MLHALRPTVLSATMSAVKKVERLSFPFQTPDPFLFAVYHDDKYPPALGGPAAASFFDLKANDLDSGNAVDFSEYKGCVCLVVNVATV